MDNRLARDPSALHPRRRRHIITFFFISPLHGETRRMPLHIHRGCFVRDYRVALHRHSASRLTHAFFILTRRSIAKGLSSVFLFVRFQHFEKLISYFYHKVFFFVFENNCFLVFDFRCQIRFERMRMSSMIKSLGDWTDGWMR